MQKGINIISGDVPCEENASGTKNATFFSVFTIEHLYKSFEKCTRNVKWKWSTQNYMINASSRIVRLYKKLMNGTYTPDKLKTFTINERGKTRNISALSFQDRVVHRCVCDYFLTPTICSKLIYDSGAMVNGKGSSFTNKRLVCHLQKYYRKYGNKGYVLRVDMHHYFESIDHDILFQKLNEIVKDERLFNFLKQAINMNENGLGLGSHISQICAMLYLNDIDHYIKEKLRCKFYARYNDDLYIISNNKNKLKIALDKIREMTTKIKLKLNDNKTKISNLENGFVFCKTRYFIEEKGKIVRLMTSKSIKVLKRKIKHGLNQIPLLISFFSYASNFNAYNKTRDFLLCDKINVLI